MELAAFQAYTSPLIKAELTRQLELVEVPALKAAMGHLLGRGKLFRPVLVLTVARSCGAGAIEPLVPLAAPVELVHTFTLIHDDLPCMDDAALRRGVAAVHLPYGEALAVLAGDALLNLALYQLSTAVSGMPDAVRRRLIAALTLATHRVCEGQVLDLQGEGCELSQPELERLHRCKTGALLGACCEIGALLAGADVELAARLRDWGISIGLAFQVRDDLLSIQSSESETGKSLGADQAKGKSTYPRLLGVDGAQRYLAELTADNVARAQGLGVAETGLLVEFARAAAVRSS